MASVGVLCCCFVVKWPANTVVLSLIANSTAPMPQRMDALLGLVTSNNLDELMGLLPLFTDPHLDEDMRHAIALALGEWASISAIEALLACANNPQTNPALLGYCLQGLARTKTPEALPCLIEALKHSDNNVFGTASEYLKYFGELAIDPLCDVLKTGETDAQCVAIWH
jgi:HEAT repeat protein